MPKLPNDYLRLIPIDGEFGLVKDAESGSVISTNRSALENRRRAKQTVNEQAERLIRIENKLDLILKILKA